MFALAHSKAEDAQTVKPHLRRETSRSHFTPPGIRRTRSISRRALAAPPRFSYNGVVMDSTLDRLKTALADRSSIMNAQTCPDALRRRNAEIELSEPEE